MPPTIPTPRLKARAARSKAGRSRADRTFQRAVAGFRAETGHRRHRRRGRRAAVLPIRHGRTPAGFDRLLTILDHLGRRPTVAASLFSAGPVSRPGLTIIVISL